MSKKFSAVLCATEGLAVLTVYDMVETPDGLRIQWNGGPVHTSRFTYRGEAETEATCEFDMDNYRALAGMWPQGPEEFMREAAMVAGTLVMLYA